MSMTIQLCGRHTFRLEGLSAPLQRLLRDYAVEQGDGPRIELTPEEIARYAEMGGGAEWIALHRRLSESLLPHSILPFHASAIEYGGRAYLFTAPSGTGKSTHTHLWRQHLGPAVSYINDDKPFLSFGQEGITVWGSPWAGKEGRQRNSSAPLGGIVVLRQAPGNSIRPLTPQEAFFPLLWQTHTYADTPRRLQVMALVERLCQVPVFSMGCTISVEAVEMALSALTQK